MAKKKASDNQPIRMKTEKKKAPKKKRKALAPLIVMLILLLIIGGAWAIFANYYGLSNYVRDEEAAAQKPIDVEDLGLTDEEVEKMHVEAQAALDGTELLANKDVYNILLIGVDRRDSSWNGNSDVMILMSINYKTKKMHMMSFMRDLYADIPGHGVMKLNAACAIGGAPLLIETIEANYKVKINNYASVDFASMAKIIDAVGGIELTMSEAEVNSANGMVQMMCQEQNEDASAHMIAGPGTFHCDGYQAVAYARIRSVGNSDFQRTERQRTVLTQIMGKLREMSFTKLNSFVRTVLPYVTHNIESGEMLGLVTKVPIVLTSYELGRSRVPYDDMFTIQKEILFPNMTETLHRIQATITAEELMEWEE